ncbi:peptidase [Limosilactobacillus reuteri]|uniref:peptidase n=1 Tax=Limosilactobacillus reuteri TaxID=1598 RepID=UPI001E6485DE|nr:peptidase [Limosilactobacillus reuteri]MCC4380441.1 peptidase [Limosilactobacillus reuteri]
MLTQSKETQDAWRASQRTLDIKVTIDGKTYGATDINSLKYDSGAYNGDTFAIGSTYSNTVQIEFSHLIERLKLGMEVRPSIGIKTSSGYVYEPLGVFIISSEIKMDRNNNLTTVSASDRFCGLEGAYVSKLTYPAKVLDVIAEICAQSGVKANTDDLARLPHQADLPAPITGQSYRKALGWIAQLYVGYALFDRQGLFTIRTISEPNYELDPSQYEQAGLTKNEAAYKINGIQCQVTLTTKTRDGESTEETKTYQAGDATGSQIKLENNIMTPQRLNDIWEQLKDLTFYPFSLNWFGNPAVEAGDWLRLEDKQSNSFVVPNSSYTLDFNGGLSATSKADQTTSSDQMVPWQGSVAQTIKELQLRRAPDGTVVFPPSVTEPPTNAKFNDVWFKKNGNSTELWIFEKQDDGSGKWIRKDLSDDEIKKKVADAQQGLNQAKADIINNKQKADADIESLNKSIEANKKVADESLQKLNDSVTNLQGQYDNNVVPNLNKVMSDASDALQKYISAQNSIADLAKRAQEQGKDIADVSNTVKGLNVDYVNLAGDVSSTKVDVKGLQTTVGTANGDIAQLKLDAQNLQTMLAGKVDNTTYTNFVNLTNQALKARLTASDLNGYAKTVDVQATANGLRVDLNSITDRMNNLKIGTRNLLHNTSDQYRTLTNDGAWLQKTTASTDMTSVANYHSGDQFTYAATVTNISNQPVQLEVQNCNQSKQWLTGKQSLAVPVGAKDYRISVSFPITADTWFIQAWLIFQGGHGVGGEQVKVKDERLVFGTVSDTWSPNPDDVAQSLTELSGRITTNSQQFSSYYTKSEADNRTNSAKNDAVNAIKSDSNWQGLNNILTNSGFLQTADGFIQKVQQTTIPMFNGGGINLVQGTAKFNFPLQSNGGVQSLQKYDNETNYIQHTASQPSFIGPWFGTFTPEIGKTYTISADVAGNGYITGDIFRYEGNDSSTLNRVDLTDNWQRISNTIHVNKISGNWVIYASNSTLLKIKHVKIEEGYVATPWSPSPFDLATQVSFSELSQSLDGLRSTVGSNYGNLQSQISQSSSAVRTELIDKVNGVQNQLTSTADSLSLKITNLKIGARNLLHNTSDQYRTLTGDGWMGVHTSSDEYTSVANYHNGNLFTYAATISNTSDVPVELQVWRCDQNKNRLTNGMLGISAYVYPGQKDVRVFLTGSIDNNTWYLQSAVYSSGGQSGQHTIQVKDERLVEGAYAGTWSSNPNDVAKNIIDLNATLQGLQSTVSGNYGNLQSQINQTATTLRGEVTDKVNGLQGQITTQANNIDLTIGSTGDLSNICRNPDFMDGSTNGWEGVGASTGNGMSPSKYYGGIQRRDAYYGKWFPVAAGDKYYFSTYAWQDQSSNSFNLGFVYEKKDGTWNWQSAVSFVPNESFKTKTGSITIPNDAVKARIWVQIDAVSNFGSWWFTNVNVRKNDTLAQINMSAGTTLIQNDKIYMDASSTIFSGNAFIPSAAITSLNADKITAGTLNAANVNIINLNANNITTGTINGQNLKINLDTGNVEFQHGHIHNFSNSVDIDLDQNYISVSSWSTKAMLKNGELQLIQPQLFDLSSDPYFRLYNGGSGSDWSAAYLEGRSGIFISPKGYKGNSVLDTLGILGQNTWAGFYTGYENGGALSPTSIGGADKGVVIHGGAKLTQTSNIFSGDGGTALADTPHIHIGTDGSGRFGGNRIVIEGEYVHVPTAWRHTTGDAPNLFIANDGALVRSTSASKYKTEIHRDYSTDYGDRLLELPTATWIDKGQKERYQAGKRSIKPKKYFGMIAEDLADAGLDLLVSKNANGEIEGIQYERIAPALIPVIRKLKKKVQELEEKLNE